MISMNDFYGNQRYYGRAKKITLGDHTLWFSYETLIAYTHKDINKIFITNENFSFTTNSHKYSVSDGRYAPNKTRVPQEVLEIIVKTNLLNKSLKQISGEHYSPLRKL